MRNQRKILIAIGLLVSCSVGGYGLYQSQQNRRALPDGAQVLDARTITFRDQFFDVLTVDPGAQELRLYWKDEAGRPYRDFATLQDALAKEGKQLRFATNAGIFSEDHTPGGLHIENGQELKKLNLRDGAGNFHLKPNGVFILGAEGAGVMETEQFAQGDRHPTIATQSGPLLVHDGQLHPAFRAGSSNLHIRNGVGVDRRGRIHFALSNTRVNFFDFASLFRERLDCPDALYLDGTISEFYLPELDRFGSGGDFCGILAVVE
ncbi:MAG: phosphodiester glycosidase family protein [Bacteroidota bacterium]